MAAAAENVHCRRRHTAAETLQRPSWDDPVVRTARDQDRCRQIGRERAVAQDFVLKVRSILFGRASDCIGMANCSNANISTDPMGDVYPCASLSGHDDTKYGNLMEQTLEEIMVAQVARSYRSREVDPHCAACKWQHVCHGGCPARSYKFFHDHNVRDYYCPSLFKIYEHIEQRLSRAGLEIGERHPSHVNDGLPLAQLSLV